MKKDIRLDIRISDNTKQKIDKICQDKNISKSIFLRQIIEEKCDEILMGKQAENIAENLVRMERILKDTGRRVSRVEGNLKAHLAGKVNNDPKIHLKDLEDYVKVVEKKYWNDEN